MSGIKIIVGNNKVNGYSRILSSSQLAAKFRQASVTGDRIDLCPFLPKSGKWNDNLEMVLFFKPECLASGVQTARLIEETAGRLAQAHYRINGASVLGWQYLRDHRIMDRHYGVINRIARHGAKAINNEANQKLNELFREDLNKYYQELAIYGGFEFMDKFNLSANELNRLWDANGPSVKLAPGTYLRKIHQDESLFYILNGFNPAQVDYYTSPGQAILIMILENYGYEYFSWSKMRLQFMGETDPAVAARKHPGSLRGHIYLKPNEFSLPVVDISHNYLHLSAGPLEAVGEIINLVLDNDWSYDRLWQTQTGRRMIHHRSYRLLGQDGLIKILQTNPIVTFPNGSTSSIFDLTENTSPSYALEQIYQAVREGRLPIAH